ncbi:MAG: aldose 1-epimerase family protein [Pedobacter sp.]|nr:aldose 1-epimerase family protein [Pedobacter sp.]MDQ8053607.1 aldose 1-epimerase family protein [Pedobacter sp.]
MIFLENEHMRASFATKGAELQHITGVDSGIEFLWSGDPKFWGKFSPVLFPIVGALKNDSYEFKGKTYQLGRHGFARDCEFTYTQPNAHEIKFTLTHDAQTLKAYPFKFILNITYKIFGSSINCTYEVINPADEEMLFSIGGHPAFAAPLNKQGDYSDYYLQFNKDEELTYHHIENNLIAETTTTIKLTDRRLPLRHELFYQDALVFKNLKSDNISLLNTKTYNGLDFKFEGFPFFGIWAAKDAPFVCLEPWCGIADSVNHQQQLKDKEGIIALQPKSNWERAWQVTFF